MDAESGPQAMAPAGSKPLSDILTTCVYLETCITTNYDSPSFLPSLTRKSGLKIFLSHCLTTRSSHYLPSQESGRHFSAYQPQLPAVGSDPAASTSPEGSPRPRGSLCFLELPLHPFAWISPWPFCLTPPSHMVIVLSDNHQSCVFSA